LQRIAECDDGMNAIVICECSDTVTNALIERGVNAHSCDLKPSEHNSPNHFQCDFRDLDYTGIDLLIAHPDCTRLANSGVRWLHERPELWEDFLDAVRIFNLILDLDVPKICVENPIHHKYARQYIRKYDQLIQPWQFGDMESKATCLWLKGLSLLTPIITQKPIGVKQSVWREAPSPERKTNRARTFKGIAQAMATQWG